MNFLRQVTENPLATNPLVVGISITLLTGIGFLVRRIFFRDKRQDAMKTGLHVEGNLNANHGIVATDQAQIHADVIGGNKNFVIQNNFLFPENIARKPLPKTEANTDKKGRGEIEDMMKRQPTAENKKRSTEIYNQTKDSSLKVQIALMRGPWFDPMEDTVSELVEMTSDAILLARRSGEAKPQLAALLSYKGMYYSFLFTHEYQEYNWKLAQRKLAKGLLPFYERELNFKDQQAQACFQEAESFAQESGDYEAQVAVYLEIGQAAAHRAATFAVGNIQRRLEEKKLVRTAHKNAENAYNRVANQLPTGGELQIANVHHNLANSLLLLQGKENLEEAKKIEQEVIKIAKKHGDSDLTKKATWILRRLEGEPPPNYYGGETRETLTS